MSERDAKQDSEPKTHTITVGATVDLEHVEAQLLEAVSLDGFGPIASNALLAHRHLRIRVEKLEADQRLLEDLIRVAPVILDLIKSIHQSPCMCGNDAHCLACRVHELVPS